MVGKKTLMDAILGYQQIFTSDLKNLIYKKSLETLKKLLKKNVRK